MFSVYNDYINNSIYVINKDGVLVQDIEYTSFDVNIADSREAARANSNYEDAETEDGGEESQTFTKEIKLVIVQLGTTKRTGSFITVVLHHVIKEGNLHSQT